MRKRLLIIVGVCFLFFGFSLEIVQAQEQQNIASSFQKSIKKQLNTSVPIVLPNKLPLVKNTYINAKATATSNSYKIVYYALPKPFAVNAKEVKKASVHDAVIRITGKRYDTKEKATNQLAMESYYSTASPKIKIQKGINGYLDAGAGSEWLSWKVDNWLFISQTATSASKKNLEIARSTMQFLKKNNLPIPKQAGVVHFGKNAQYYGVKWQQDKIIYEVQLVKDSTTLLQIMSSIK
ncbi:MAG: hypothetical protein KBT36_07785 [Kurthia sp.]|nr:hypothetical protein [Candidatus Kurthia equi]